MLCAIKEYQVDPTLQLVQIQPRGCLFTIHSPDGARSRFSSSLSNSLSIDHQVVM